MKKWSDIYGNTANPPTTAFPFGSAKNSTTETSEDGTPIDDQLVNDPYGFMTSVMAEGGITPNGQSESKSNPQVLTALKNILSTKGYTQQQAHAGDSQLAGGNIWPVDATKSATDTDTGLMNVISLRDAITGILYWISDSPVSGDITALDFDSGTATINGDAVTLQDVRQSSEHMFDSVDSLKNANGISKDAIDKLDIPVGTMSYYPGWAATSLPYGYAKYTLTTLQRVRDSLSDQTWEPDGFGDHYLSIGDGATYVAILVNDGDINVQSFGFIPDNIERSDALQASINYAKDIGAFIYIPPAGTVDDGYRYRINKTINIPVGMNIRGGGPLTLIFAESGGNYINNFAFLINTTDGNDAIVTNANFRVGTISNIYLAAGDNFIKCFAFSGAAEFYNVRTRFFAQAVKGSSEYNDHVTIRRCNFATNIVGADYQIELDNLGDGCVIDQVQMANVGDNPLTPQRSIKITGCRAKITNCLYGIVYIINVPNSTSIENCGMDGGYYIIERSNVSIRDSGISALESGRFPIVLSNDTDFAYKLTIDNLIIGHDIFRGAFEPQPYDIKLANNYVVDVKNMVRRVFNSNAPSSYNQFGVKMELESGVPFDEFNDLSHFYSTRCTIMDQKVVSGEISLKLPPITLNYFSKLAPFQSDAWGIASGTYFYKITVYWDINRAVSRSDIAGERSIALINGGDAAILEIGTAAYPPSVYLRVYRGKSTGNYDKYADIPVIDASSLVDNGNTISGFEWISRASGPADPSNLFNLNGYNNRNGLAEVLATAIPTAGTWQKGDMIIFPPAAGGQVSSGCVATGSPGTWKSAGNYEA